METATSTPTTTATPSTPNVGTSTPVSGGTTTPSTERPKTFQEAFARDAQTPASTPETAAIGQDAPPVVPTDTPTGPIPLEVHRQSLENARKKAAAEAQAAFDRDFGWAKTVDRSSLDAFNQLSADPVAFVTELAQRLASHPTYGQQMRSQAGKTLAAGRAKTQLDTLRNVVIDVGEGKQPIALFPLVQQAIEQAVEPFKAESAQRKAEREQAEAAEASKAYVTAVGKAADDALSDISDVLEIGDDTPKAQKDALYEEVHTLLAADPTLSIHKAAMRVRKNSVVPRINERAESKVLETLKNKAGAQQVNPAAPAVSTTSRITSFKDPRLTW